MTNDGKQRKEKGAGVFSEALRNTEVNAAREAGGDDEFKLTVRKLEMPVRPRGVLAE